MKKLLIIFLCLTSKFNSAQAFEKGTIVGTIGMGAPHTIKAIVKTAAESERFDQLFKGKLVVKDFTGMYPLLYKAEYGFKKYFSLGISGGMWTMNFSVEDHYNIQKSAQITGKDSLDTYKFHIKSNALGIRPNLHIPLKKQNFDIFLGFGLGINKNKMVIDFSSTDVNRVFPDLEYELSLPGGIYFSPTIGFRKYFNEYIGLNFELGYDKGAIVSGGLALRLNYAYNKPN